MKTLTRTVCALLAAAPAAADPIAGPEPSDTTALVRVTVDSWAELERLERAGAEPLACRPAPGEQLFAIDADRLGDLEGAEILERDLEAAIEALRGPARGGGFFDDYQSFAVIDARLDELALSPRAEIVTVGDTLEGRTVRGVRIRGAGVGPRPAVLVSGAQHAREWISPAACMYLAEQLIDGYGVDPRLTSILDGVDIYVVPVVNADGYEYSRTPGNRFWRKNRRPNGDGTFGVDPNRNWSIAWGLSSGSSGWPGSQIYRGPAPFSEPCTSNLRDFILSRPEIRGHVDVHSFSQLVLGAWAHTNTPAPEGETLLPLGEAINSAIVAEFGSDFDFRTGDGGIGLAAGVAPDWSFGELGVPAWTFELRDQGFYGFVLPPEQIVPASIECMAGVVRLAEQIALCPYDANLDGTINSLDLGILLSRWGSERGLMDADLTGFIGSGDLGGMLAAWGTDCGL